MGFLGTKKHAGFARVFFCCKLQTSLLQQSGNLGFPTQSHDMQTLAVGLALLDDLCGDLNTGDTGLSALLVGSQSVDHMLRHMDTSNVVVHELSHAGRLG